MSSNYSPDLRIELITNGEQSGTWGTTTNSNLGTLIEQAIAKTYFATLTASVPWFVASNGAADVARCAAVDVAVDGSITNDFTAYAPPVPKLYVIKNSTAYVMTLRNSTTTNGDTPTPTGTAVVIPAGKTVVVRSDGTNVISQFDYIPGNLTVGNNQTVTGNETVNGNLTANQTATVVDSAFLGLSQTASIAIASPTVITATHAPATGSAVTFSTTGTLPTGLTVGTTYFVSKINSTTFNISASPTLTPLVDATVSGTGTHTVITVSLALTPPVGSNNTQIATTAFAQGAANTAALAGGTLVAAQNYATPVTIASASSVAIGAAASNVVNISGTTTITSFDTIAAGAVRLVNFTGAMLLTYNATSLILPGNANITTAAGDSAVFESLGSGNWQCIQYTRALQSPFISPIPNVVVRTTTGTFTVPTGVSKIKVRLVAGGGAGYTRVSDNPGGGGGGGGVEAWLVVTAGLVLTITIGAGGVSNGAGGNSTITGTGVSITVTGGSPGQSPFNGGNGGQLTVSTVPAGSVVIAHSGAAGQSGAAGSSGIGAGSPVGGSSMLGGGGGPSQQAGYGGGGDQGTSGTAGACIIEY